MSNFLRPDATDAVTAWELPEVTGKAGGALRTARQLEQLQEQAWKEAWAQGQAEGYKAGLAEARANAVTLAAMADKLHEPLKDLDQAVVDQLTQLAITIASHMVRREIKQDPQQIISVAREGVRLLPVATRSVQLRVHPDDAALLREHIGAEHGWTMVEDPTVTRGGCSVQADHSHVDMRVERRIGEIAAAILGGERETDK